MRPITKWYHNLSVFYKILIWMLAVSIIPLFVMVMFDFKKSLSIESSRCQSEVVNQLRWIEGDVTAEVDELRLQGIKISLDGMVRSELSKSEEADEKNYYEVKKHLFDISVSGSCHSAYIMDFNGMQVSNCSAEALNELVSGEMEALVEQLNTGTKTYSWGEPIRYGSDYLLPYARFIPGEKSTDPVGVFIANYNESDLARITKKTMNDSEIRVENVLIINDGEVISSWDKELIGTSFTGKDTFNAKYNGKTCRFLYYENGNASVWSYVAIVSQREIYAASRSIVQFFVFTSLICIICIILASYLVSRSISKPLEYLSGAMQDIGNNNLNIELKAPNYQDEVGKMWGCLIEMKDTLKKSMDDSRAAMEQNQRLRLEALKAQINPHFLYNTFGSVIYLVEEGKKEEAIEMLVALSELLHISLSRSQELITVEQELGLLRRYMDIQKVRYENRFRYLIDVDIDIMKLYMVKIVLQPVVENVLEHGLKQKADIQALICIRGWREKELLIFEVSDNCNTLTFQRMEEVNRKIHGTEPARAAKTGIGLKNVNDRICYEFSNDKRLGVWMAKREKETVTRIVLKVEEGLDDGTI